MVDHISLNVSKLAAGGVDNGKPVIREQYAPNYYTAFVTDPDGNNIEAVLGMRYNLLPF